MEHLPNVSHSWKRRNMASDGEFLVGIGYSYRKITAVQTVSKLLRGLVVHLLQE